MNGNNRQCIEQCGGKKAVHVYRVAPQIKGYNADGRKRRSGGVGHNDEDNISTPHGGFWEQVRGCHALMIFISEGVLPLKL